MAFVNLDRAVELLNLGDVVALPTETVYGLAGRIDHPGALHSIFTTKRRPFFDPLIVHVSSADEVHPLIREWRPAHRALAETFWPGPLTLVIPKAPGVSPLITSGLDTVGLRCPAHPLAREVLRRVGMPLAAPSANMFGRTSPTTALHVETEFSGEVAVLDGGPCAVGVESTVLLVTEDRVNLLRPGGVDAEQIERCLLNAGLNLPVVRLESQRSPGHLEAHYQPANPVVFASRSLSPIDLTARARAAFGTSTLVWLNLPADPALAARTLYSELRRLSETYAVILVDRDGLPGDPSWEAILDRLRRASTTSWT